MELFKDFLRYAEPGFILKATLFFFLFTGFHTDFDIAAAFRFFTFLWWVSIVGYPIHLLLQYAPWNQEKNS